MRHPDLGEIEKELAETSQISNDYLNHKLKIFTFRWVITFLLLLLLWNKFMWLKWILVLLVPIGIYKLWLILSTKFKLNRKMEEIQQTIDNIEGK